MRDLGAFTEPSPTAVRLDDAGGAVLVCENQRGDSLTIVLESAAEAVALARAPSAPSVLPLQMPEAAWLQRAVASSRLPEFAEHLWEEPTGRP